MFALQVISVAAALIYVACGEVEPKKSAKRGIDDYGYPLGYNGWASTLKLNPVHTYPSFDQSNLFTPSAHDLSHLVAAAKQAAHDVYLAQQYVNAAKEDVLFAQKIAKEKEALALIAHQKSESAQQVWRGEAQNVVHAQQKLAKAKAYAADLQLKQTVKDAEAARAIQSSATHANGEIQKAEQAAKLSYFKQSIRNGPGHSGPSSLQGIQAPWNAGPWNAAPFANKPIGHAFHPY